MTRALRQQRRGKARPKYLAKVNSAIDAGLYPINTQVLNNYTVLAFKNDPLKSSILAQVLYDNGKKGYLPSVTGLDVGRVINLNQTQIGSIVNIGNLLDGSIISNIERSFNDGGSLCRTGGSYATVISNTHRYLTTIRLPSKKLIILTKTCRALLGVLSGGERYLKPYLKAGKKFHCLRASNREFPIVSRNAMNVISHPYGGSGKHRPGRPTVSARNAPPGAKVGCIAARRTGKKK